MDKAQLRNELEDRALQRLGERRSTLPPELFVQVARFALLRSLDEAWKDHLLELDNLKSGIGLRGYGQKDPLIEFKREGFGLFEEFIERVDRDSLHALFHLEVAVQPAEYEGEDLSQVKTRHDGSDSYRQAARQAEAGQAAAPSTPASAIAASGQPPAPPKPISAGPKVGRNDPCPCGSGQKFKRCCGKAGV